MLGIIALGFAFFGIGSGLSAEFSLVLQVPAMLLISAALFLTGRRALRYLSPIILVVGAVVLGWAITRPPDMLFSRSAPRNVR